MKDNSSQPDLNTADKPGSQGESDQQTIAVLGCRTVPAKKEPVKAETEKTFKPEKRSGPVPISSVLTEDLIKKTMNPETKSIGDDEEHLPF